MSETSTSDETTIRGGTRRECSSDNNKNYCGGCLAVAAALSNYALSPSMYHLGHVATINLSDDDASPRAVPVSPLLQLHWEMQGVSGRAYQNDGNPSLYRKKVVWCFGRLSETPRTILG